MSPSPNRISPKMSSFLAELRELAATNANMLTEIRRALASENVVLTWAKLQKCQADQLKKLALHTKDMDKNRYKDVLPYSNQRVILSNGGYINASEVRDAKWDPSSGSSASPSAPYIACQGPLKHTSGDFWDMIIDKNVHDVVMLTGITENGREKCHNYFEMDGKKHRVRCLQRSSVAGVEVRDLEVKRGPISHRVTHYQLMTWPDHGVPGTPAVLDPLLDVLYDNAKSGRTTVVHCSAGIGRSGVLIALSIFAMRVRVVLSRGAAGCRSRGDNQACGTGVGSADDLLCCSFTDIVSGMREQRAGMVQTPIQLKFCIDAATRLVVS